MGAAAASLFAGIRRSSRWSLLEDSGETSFSNRNEPFRFEEEEPGESCRYSAKSRIPAIHSCDDAVPFGAFLSLLSLGEQRKKPAGGDGPGNQIAEASGESAEARRIARCGGDGDRTKVLSLLQERPSFAARRKKAKARPREPISRRFPWESLPDDQGGSAPIGFPTIGRETGVYGGRWTMSPPPSLRDQPAGWLLQSVPPAPTSAHHAGVPPSLPCKSVPPRGAFPFPAPENFPAPHCNICPPVV